MSKHNTARPGVLRITLQLVLVVGLLVGVGSLAARGFERTKPAEAEFTDALPPRRGELFDREPALLVITDSIGGVVSPDVDRYPELLADQLGWTVTVDSRGGRGFLPTDLSEIGINEIVPPFIDSLKYDAENFKADVIIVDGGRNDLGKDPSIVAAAIADYLTKLRAYYPDAQIAIVAPSYITPLVTPNASLLSQAIRESAERIGAYVFDPVAEGWYSGIDLAPLLWTDGIHLSSAGGDYYARKLAENLRQVGIVADYQPGRGER